MSKSKTIILCADDFGLNPAVSVGILQLVTCNRLSAVSCMVNLPDFNTAAPQLLALNNQVHIGMHFNLTEGYLLSNPSTSCFTLNELLIKSHLYSVPYSLIAGEFNTQLDHYVKTMGRFPDFIDGHQHVHHFPKIRQVILDLYAKRLKGKGVFIRATYPVLTPLKYQLKAKILALTGGKALQKQLATLAIPHNAYFSGVYDFDAKTEYRALFRQWLALAKNNTLIMCHPGVESSNTDPIASARSKELAYLLSDDFLTDCQDHQITLTHLNGKPKILK